MKPSQEREDYQECVTSVIKKYQGPSSVKRNKKLQSGLAACKDRYPAVSIMIDCKKEMAAAYRESRNTACSPNRFWAKSGMETPSFRP